MISPPVALRQLLSDRWAMEPTRLGVFIDEVARRHVDVALRSPERDTEQSSYRINKDGIAHIEISGVMLKQVPWFISWMGINATSTVDTRFNLKKALYDPDVKSIQLDIDSPGGQLAGVQELADDVFRARSVKPIAAVVSDTAASAAYWVASQTETIIANKAALIGSIGIYAVLFDASKMAEDIGLKAYVIRSADFKGIGATSAEGLTDKRLAAIQREVDAIADLFIGEVAKGRDVSVADVKKSATGEVWLADEAKARGLIDQVGSPVADNRDKEDDTPPPAPDNEDGIGDGEDEDEDNNHKNGTAPSGALTNKEGSMGTQNAKPDPEGANTDTGTLSDKARADAALAQLTELRRRSCLDMIEAAVKAGRVLQPARKHVEAYAESAKWEGELLKAFLDEAFATRHTHPERESDTPEEDCTSTVPSDTEADKLAAWLGIPEDARKKYAGVVMITPTGELLDGDGQEVIQ